MMLRIAPLLLLLAGCGEQSIRPENNQMSASRGQAKAIPTAAPLSIEEKTDLYEFDFSWSSEAAAIPELVQRLSGEMDKTKAELAGGAEEEKDRREKEGMDFHPYMSSTVYETAGQSARLLSLRVDAGGYEGGAHGNFGVGALLWDRQAKREIKFEDLFADPSNRDRLLTQRWCDALNRSREEKRGEPVGGGGMFDDCPDLDDIAIIPVDSDRDGRFEELLLAASPYVAGPWVEGAYEIKLAVSPELVAGIKREFQPSFAA